VASNWRFRRPVTWASDRSAIIISRRRSFTARSEFLSNMAAAKQGSDPSPQPSANVADAAEIRELTFEAALARLETIVRDLEEGRIGLAEALARYELGSALLRQCYALLQTAEQRIELLTCVGPDGRAVTQEFEHVDAASSGVPGRSRGKRRPAETAVADPCDEASEAAPTSPKPAAPPAPPQNPQSIQPPQPPQLF
jgi:exodeoxyribonuclease VII small subunit